MPPPLLVGIDGHLAGIDHADTDEHAECVGDAEDAQDEPFLESDRREPFHADVLALGLDAHIAAAGERTDVVAVDPNFVIAFGECIDNAVMRGWKALIKLFW